MSDIDAQDNIKQENENNTGQLQTEEPLTEPKVESNQPKEEEEVKASEQDSDSEEDQSTKPEEIKYKNGEVLRFVRIRFPGNSRSFPFLLGEKDYNYGQQVVAMSDRGLDIGYINSFPYEAKFREAMLPLKSISKVAGKEDFEKIASMKDREFEAENICKELIGTHKLEMDLTHVELIQFGKKAVFYFIAPKRVDFRNLVKDLVTKLKLIVELRQISVRDRAAALGGIGPCGRELCCSTFLGNYGRVNIRMAKNQNMALNPTRLNGLCGQLKCCLSYEDNVYTGMREQLPKEGSFVQVANGDQGKILKLHILILRFDMLTDQGQIRRYTFDQYDPNLNLPKDWKFPQRFDHVMNETSKVIGNDKVEEEEEDEFLFQRVQEPSEPKAEEKIQDKEQAKSEPAETDPKKNQKLETQSPQKELSTSEKKPNNRSRNRNNNRRRNRKPKSSTTQKPKNVD